MVDEVSNSPRSKALEFSSDKRPWNPVREQDRSCAGWQDIDGDERGHPACSIRWWASREGGREVEPLEEARLLLDWLHQQFPKTFEQTTDTWHFDVLTREWDVSFCGMYPLPPSFDRSIPLADIGSRATLPLLDKFAFQLVIAQHDSLLRTHPLRSTPFTFRLSSSQLYFWPGGHSVFRGEWLYEWKWRDGLD